MQKYPGVDVIVRDSACTAAFSGGKLQREATHELGRALFSQLWETSPNLITGSMSGLFLVILWHSRSALLFGSTSLMLLTTLVYHGAHCLGFERWASKFMLFDTTAVALVVCSLLYLSRSGVVFFIALSAFLLWMNSFPGRPLHGLPFNLLLSALHCYGLVAHLYVVLALA